MPFPIFLNRGVLFAAALVSILLTGCGGGGTSTVDPARITSSWAWTLPINFPTPFVPANNPMSEAKFQLGRYLFYDKKLSGNGTKACSSCHFQNLAFTDGKAVSRGATGQSTPRSSMSIANSVYHPTLTWARPDLTSLEQQAAVPMFGTNPVELGISGNEVAVLARFQADPFYVNLFSSAFPNTTAPITFANIINAIATFERGVLSGDSKYDQYLKGQATLTASEMNGNNVFNTEKAECFHCHTGHNFNLQNVYAGIQLIDKTFSNTGLYNIDGVGGYPAPNRGVFEVTQNPLDMGFFRAPSLRNVAITAPYMHDGSIATLSEVVATYAAAGRNIPAGQPNAGDGRLNQFKDPLIPRINLTLQEQADLVAFLGTLTDQGLLTNPRYANPFPLGTINNP
ncbi:MAG: MbnH family di-heme enzyme [Gallionella sp.]